MMQDTGAGRIQNTGYKSRQDKEYRIQEQVGYRSR